MVMYHPLCIALHSWLVADGKGYSLRSILILATTTAKAPTPRNLSDRLQQGENWKFYELAAGIHTKADEVRVASLLNVVCKETLDMYETIQWEDASHALKIDKFLENFEESCVPARNETYERFVFFKREQLPSESLNCYITALMKLSENCGFGMPRESLVRDRLILGVKDDRIGVKLLGKRDLDLDKAVEMIKARRVIHSRASEIADEALAQEDVSALKHKPRPQRKSEKWKLPKSSTRNPSSNSKLKECLFCGGKHALDRKLCPASGQTCKKCGKVGHLAVKCRSKSVNVNVNDVKEVFYINNIGGKDQALVPVTLTDTVSITFETDTGSSANILPLEDYTRATNDFKRASIVPKDITLVMHDHSKRKALGSARVTPLLGLKSCQGMGLVKIMVPGFHAPINNVVATPEKAVSESITTDSVLKPFADVFQDYRNTPTKAGSSPAQRVFSRRTRNLLPPTPRLLEAATVPPMDVQQKLMASRQKQAYYYNLKEKALPELQPGRLLDMKKPNKNT
ncbi:hypothetical protein AWC38_SpisGene19760 [Stylophora pistillata]|uniref:CCHC-type domain-containing protein n=1 Tax=Stylophora pistillata TaxID=50429 RepID=A0A2B4RHP6_STYPI|nr:hypothetical protein AWC38_SpisGene19760 [Stylophora pistillata]